MISSTRKPGFTAATSVQYRKPTSVGPVKPDRSAVSATQPPEAPVMPLPKFWPFGSSLVDRFVGTGVHVAPPSVEATAYA